MTDRIHLLNGHRKPDKANDLATKKDVRAIIVELVGALAHSLVELEAKLAAMELHLGLTYNPAEHDAGGIVSEIVPPRPGTNDTNAPQADGGDIE